MLCYLRRITRQDCDELSSISDERLFNSLNWMRYRTGKVVEYSDKVVGFVIYDKNIVDHKLIVVDLVVLPSFRRQSIGTQIIEHLKRVQLCNNIRPSVSSNNTSKFSTTVYLKTIEIHVRETNLPAQLCLQKLGFVGSVVHGHFVDEPRDAYLMSYQFPGWKS